MCLLKNSREHRHIVVCLRVRGCFGPTQATVNSSCAIFCVKLFLCPKCSMHFSIQLARQTSVLQACLFRVTNFLHFSNGMGIFFWCERTSATIWSSSIWLSRRIVGARCFLVVICFVCLLKMKCIHLPCFCVNWFICPALHLVWCVFLLFSLHFNFNLQNTFDLSAYVAVRCKQNYFSRKYFH